MSPTVDDKSPLSIALFSPAWPSTAFPNGIIPYVEVLANRFEALGHRVTVLTNGISGKLTDPKVRVVDLEAGTPTLPTRLINSVSYRLAPEATARRIARQKIVDAFRRIVADRQVQVIEIEETQGWSWWIQKAVSVPVCVRLHGPWFLNGKASGAPEDDAYRQRVADERRAIAAADFITAPSQDVLDQTRAYYGLALPHAEVIPAPFPATPPADRWRLDACTPNLAGFIGRFDRHKGADLLIEAFALVLKEIPDAKLCCIGAEKTLVDDNGRGWTPKDFIRDRIPGALESGAVEFLGHQPLEALASLRRRAMVTVIPSRYDNFPTTVMEAASQGCPIVAARAGGIVEMLSDGVSGLLHNPNDPRDIARKIIAIMKDPELAARLGAQAHADTVGRFALDGIAARTIEAYRSMLGK